MSVTYFGPQELTKDYFNERLVHSPPSIVSLDTETISLKERMPIGFSIATAPDESWYFNTYPELDAEVELVLPLLRSPHIKKVMHNSLFDLRALPLVLDRLDTSNIADTNVMARLLGRIETKLPILAQDDLGIIHTSAKEMLGPGQTMLDLPRDDVAIHCAKDSMICLQLYYLYHPDIDKNYFDIEMKAIPIVIDMSLRGLKVNQEDRDKLETRLEAEVHFYRKLCNEEYEFNPASNQQVGYILAKRGNFLPFTRSKKQLKVDEEQLEFLDDPLASVVLNFRKANKLLTTYVVPLRGQDRAYTEFNFDAVVGRISSSNMNLQNIPGADSPTGTGGARYIFIPDSGIFTYFDFSQLHLRILAYLSGDKEMRRVYEDGEHDGDLHIKTAKDLRITRKIARNVNYAIPYGGTARCVSTMTKIKDVRRCSAFLDSWFETYRDAAEWIKTTQEEGVRDGWALPTLFDRRIKLPDENVESMQRKAVNYPILGSDGEIIKRALIICHRHNLPMVTTSHDSICCDGEVEFPREELENITPFRIPIEIHRSERWE